MEKILMARISHWIRSVERNKKILVRVLIWIPTLVTIVGLTLTVALFQFLRAEEQKSRDSFNTRREQEITDRVDLSLGNSILRVESYEEMMGFRPENNHGMSRFLRSALPYTIFQRLTIFKETSVAKASSPKSVESSLAVIFRMTLPSSRLPQANNDYIQSTELLEKIRSMESQSKPSEIFLYDRAGSVRLSVILKSKTQAKTYFLFTAPIETLFKESELSNGDQILLKHIGEGPQWVLSESSHLGSFHILDQNNQDLSSNFSGQAHRLKHSSLPVELKYLFAPTQSEEISASSVVAATGGIISIGLGFLFFILINQSRKISRLLVERTSNLEMTAHRLHEALEAKNKFLGKVSHEIRTPLNLILGMIDLFKEEPLDPKLSHYLNGMKSSGEHLLIMIDDLIDLAKTDSTRLHFQNQSIDTIHFLSDILRLIGQVSSKKNLRLYAYFDPNVPAFFIGDPNRIRQILMNLLRNAIKYTERGSISFRISYQPKTESSQAFFIFDIEDTGKGIAEDKVEKIFEAFFQVEGGIESSEGGVGLGLSIVRDLINTMHGTIEVKSKPKIGSKFRVRLPLMIESSDSWLSPLTRIDGNLVHLVCVSNDPQLLQCFEPLAAAANIKLSLWSSQNFKTQMNQRDLDLKNSWIVVDQKTAPLESNHLARFEGRCLQMEDSPVGTNVLSIHPLLLNEILSRMGFSNRTRVRKDLPTNSSLQLSQQKQIPSSGLGIQQASLPENLRMLVADDDLGNIDLYKAYFSQMAWRVDYLVNGKAAWDRYLETSPELCIIDVRMPFLDGFQVVEKIRAHEKAQSKTPVPIILITADLVEMHEEKIKELERVVLLTKPIRKARLFSVIQETLKPQIQQPA